MPEALRIGTLGAARITPSALVRPARELAEAEVVAVAARDPARARKFADRTVGQNDPGMLALHRLLAATVAKEPSDA